MLNKRWRKPKEKGSMDNSVIHRQHWSQDTERRQTPKTQHIKLKK